VSQPTRKDFDNVAVSVVEKRSQPDWLEMATERPATRSKNPQLTTSGRKSLDMADNSDWLGLTGSTNSERDEPAAPSDYLRLGSEISLGHKPPRFRSLFILII